LTKPVSWIIEVDPEVRGAARPESRPVALARKLSNPVSLVSVVDRRVM
jgi:hypothetical protein